MSNRKAFHRNNHQHLSVCGRQDIFWRNRHGEVEKSNLFTDLMTAAGKRPLSGAAAEVEECEARAVRRVSATAV